MQKQLNYKKGARNEYRTMRLLEGAGFTAVRAAGSHGPFDVLGWNASGFILVQVKTNGWPTPAEREKLASISVPPNAQKLVHRWNDRASQPLVQEI